MKQTEFENMVNEVESGNTLYLNDFKMDDETYHNILNQIGEVFVNSIAEGFYVNHAGNYKYYEPKKDLIFFEN